MAKRQWLEEYLKDLTHEQAAEMSGLDRSTVTKAINGSPVGIKAAKKMAAAFGFSWTLFFEDRCDVSGQTTA